MTITRDDIEPEYRDSCRFCICGNLMLRKIGKTGNLEQRKRYEKRRYCCGACEYRHAQNFPARSCVKCGQRMERRRNGPESRYRPGELEDPKNYRRRKLCAACSGAFLWTEERKAQLVALFHEGLWAAEIGERLGRSANAVNDKLNELGFYYGRSMNKWPAERELEIEYLAKQRLGLKEISQRMGITPSSARSKLCRMRLSYGAPRKSIWTPERTAEIHRLVRLGLRSTEIARRMRIGQKSVANKMLRLGYRLASPLASENNIVVDQPAKVYAKSDRVSLEGQFITPPSRERLMAGR